MPTDPLGAAVLAFATGLVEQLTAAGAHTTTDVRAVPVPGVWLCPDETVPEDPTATGYATPVQWSLWLVAPDNGDPLPHLCELLGAVLGQLDPSGPVEMNRLLALPGGTHPAFRVPVRVHL